LRGGASDGTKRRTKKTKKSSRKKRASSKADSSEKEGRQAINVAMREKDAAAAMGDAIRYVFKLYVFIYLIMGN
jgi:hypothetical protein